MRHSSFEGKTLSLVPLWFHWQNWRDEYLTWNPDLHGGITRLNFDTGLNAQIWTPDVVVFSASVQSFILVLYDWRCMSVNSLLPSQI